MDKIWLMQTNKNQANYKIGSFFGKNSQAMKDVFEFVIFCHTEQFELKVGSVFVDRQTILVL